VNVARFAIQRQRQVNLTLVIDREEWRRQVLVVVSVSALNVGIPWGRDDGVVQWFATAHRFDSRNGRTW
jgi:hypothetical protein